MSRLPILGFLALLYGCSEPKTAAADVEWQFQYEGELGGTVQGEILAVTAVMTNLTLAGGAYGESPGQRATQKFRMSLSLTADGQARSALMNLTLPDGTTCRSASEAAAEIRDADKQTFDASFAGELDCDGKAVTFEGWTRADP